MKDAWEQLSELMEKYTTSTKVREDIEVVAHGTERAVELVLWGEKQQLRLRSYKTTGPRNVGTMRELAQALLDACDFVDQANPEWAARAHPEDAS